MKKIFLLLAVIAGILLVASQVACSSEYPNPFSTYSGLVWAVDNSPPSIAVNDATMNFENTENPFNIYAGIFSVKNSWEEIGEPDQAYAYAVIGGYEKMPMAGAGCQTQQFSNPFNMNMGEGGNFY